MLYECVRGESHGPLRPFGLPPVEVLNPPPLAPGGR